MGRIYSIYDWNRSPNPEREIRILEDELELPRGWIPRAQPRKTDPYVESIVGEVFRRLAGSKSKN